MFCMQSKYSDFVSCLFMDCYNMDLCEDYKIRLD